MEHLKWLKPAITVLKDRKNILSLTLTLVNVFVSKICT